MDGEGLEGETSCAGMWWTTQWAGPSAAASATLVQGAALLEGSLQASGFPHVPPLTSCAPCIITGCVSVANWSLKVAESGMEYTCLWVLGLGC